MGRKKNILKLSAKQRRGRSSAYPWSCTTPVAEFPCPEPQLRDCFPKVFLPSVVLFAVCREKEMQGFAMLCIVALTHSCQLHVSCAVLSFGALRLQPGDITGLLSPLLDRSCHALQRHRANSHVLPLLLSLCPPPSSFSVMLFQGAA